MGVTIGDIGGSISGTVAGGNVSMFLALDSQGVPSEVSGQIQDMLAELQETSEEDKADIVERILNMAAKFGPTVVQIVTAAINLSA